MVVQLLLRAVLLLLLCVTQLCAQPNHRCSQGQSVDTLPDSPLQPSDYMLPSVFSPDGNGLYDAFTVYTSQQYAPTIKIMRIFDRWDNLIFERSNFQVNDVSMGWDGTFQGKPVAMGVFSYYVAIILKDGTILNKWGEVIVLD